MITQERLQTLMSDTLQLYNAGKVVEANDYVVEDLKAVSTHGVLYEGKRQLQGCHEEYAKDFPGTQLAYEMVDYKQLADDGASVIWKWRAEQSGAHQAGFQLVVYQERDGQISPIHSAMVERRVTDH